MKILVLSGTSALSSATQMPAVGCGADSALLRAGQPLFLPDHLGKWESRICPAVRICRLGMNIPEKSAASHYNAITTMHMLTPVGSTPAETALILDRAFAAGEWLPEIPETLTIHASSTPLSGKTDKNTCTASATISTASLNIERAIASVSRFSTLKMGDIIVFTDLAAHITPEIDTQLQTGINNLTTLTLKIK